jgi:predicted AAA+ superfamily ATPase
LFSPSVNKQNANAKRETSSLFQAVAELSIREATLVTMDDEETIKGYGRKIKVVPAWKYLLGPGDNSLLS